MRAYFTIMFMHWNKGQDRINAFSLLRQCWLEGLPIVWASFLRSKQHWWRGGEGRGGGHYHCMIFHGQSNNLLNLKVSQQFRPRLQAFLKANEQTWHDDRVSAYESEEIMAPSPEIADIRYCVITFHPRGRPTGSVKICKDLYGY